MANHAQSGPIKKRQWIGPQASFHRKRLKPGFAGRFPTFEQLLEESLPVMPFQHHPKIAGNTTALEDLADPAKNDVLSNIGSAVHGAHVAAVLYKFFFALTLLYTKDCTVGRIESHMSNSELPTTDEGMKAAADTFKAKLWYCTTMYEWDEIATFYENFINATLAPALNDFDPSTGSKHYIRLVNRSRNGEFNRVSPHHERPFLGLMRSRSHILIYIPLQDLKIPEDDDVSIKFNNDNHVVGPCRPMLQLGTLLYKAALVVKCDDLFPRHRSVEEGGSELQTAICRLAGCKSIINLCVRWAGMHRSGRETFSDDKLPSIFFVAVAKLWIRDPAKFWDVMDDITLPAVWFSNKVLSAAGIGFNIIIPGSEDVDKADDVEVDGEDAEKLAPPHHVGKEYCNWMNVNQLRSPVFKSEGNVNSSAVSPTGIRYTKSDDILYFFAVDSKSRFLAVLTGLDLRHHSARDLEADASADRFPHEDDPYNVELCVQSLLS
ncbi:hypothetical protein ONZ45_g4038 [Pleurotus djamor]|nr:hypothetical protein ONZ45_g4038 [Pleurotus djamor]